MNIKIEKDIKKLREKNIVQKIIWHDIGKDYDNYGQLIFNG